jgi:hypothetical protein
MYTSHSILWTFALLSLPFSDARVTNQHAKHDVVGGDSERPLAKRQQYPPSACVNDIYVQWLEFNAIGPQFCARFMSSPTITNTIYLTPTV